MGLWQNDLLFDVSPIENCSCAILIGAGGRRFRRDSRQCFSLHSSFFSRDPGSLVTLGAFL